MPLFKGEKQPKQISKVKQLEICPDGDMEIALSCPNNVTYRYQVSSLQLCACSSVFRAMLGPKSSFSEAVALQNHRLLQSENPGVDGLYNLKVEDHDPTALVAVLNIIHGHPEKLPDEIPFEGLVQVALICDFYDCAAAMRPWDKTWMEQWQNDAKTPGFESWLFIARVFKEEDVFQTLSRKLVTNSIVEDGEFKVVVSKEPIARVVKRLDNYIPQDSLLEQRENLCQEITKIWRELYNRYEDNTKIHCTYKSPSKLCDYYVFGEFHKELKAAGILTEVQHHHWTPKYLVSIIEKVLETIFAHLNDPVRFNSDDHYKCLGFRTDVVSRMKSELNKIALVPWVPSAEPNGAKERSWDNLLSEYNSRTEVEVVRY